MGTYDHKKLLSDWATGRITNDMATGHTLQHIDLLYQGQTEANQRRQEIRDTAEGLKRTVTTLKREKESLRRQVEQLQQQVEAFNVTLYQLKDEVDSLKLKPGQAPQR